MSPRPCRIAPGAARRGLFCAGPGALGRLAWAGLALVLVLGSGCAGKNAKPSVADTEVTAVSKLVAAMAQDLKTRDTEALVGLWDPAHRSGVADRIEKALKEPGEIDLRLSLIGLRLEADTRLARVAWSGTWGGNPVSGGFDMELTGDPPRIVAIRGEDPSGAGTPAGTPDFGTVPSVLP